MSYIGVIGAARLDGCEDGLPGVLERKETADRMLKDGADMREIKAQTGWERGVDRKWHYEIDDPFLVTAELEDHLKRHYGEPIDIRRCLKGTALLTAYPVLERLLLFGLYRPIRGSVAGYFDPERYAVVVCMGTASAPFDLQTEGVLLHEVQHLIQAEEDFARGGDSSKGMRRYRRLAGEVEARNVCTRHLLSPEERKAKLRTETQDVPDEDQIIIFE